MKSSSLARVTTLMILASCLLWPPISREQDTLPADLDAYVTRAMVEFQVPGLALGIVKDGNTVLVKGYGVRKLGTASTVNEHTVFGIGSNTKAFTAAALASLVDQGKLSWDDLVRERLPGFQMYDPYASHEMTLRDMLTHRSGLGLGQGDLLTIETTYPRDEIVRRLRFMKPVYSFRSRYAYSNLLYIAAGQIIPALTGRSWDDYVRQEILEPLGMMSSNTSFKASNDNAWPHSRIGGNLQVIDFSSLENSGPAAGINSSAADMCKWMLLQLNHGKFGNGETRLFSEKQSREMWSAHTILPIGEPAPQLGSLKAKFAAYGIGFRLRDYHGRKLVGHSGALAGFVSLTQLIPEENLGIVLLSNAEESRALDAILFRLIDHYLGLPRKDWIVAFKSAQDDGRATAAQKDAEQTASRASNSTSSLPLEKYAGVYTDAWYGPATIHFEHGKLVMSMDHTPKMLGELEHWQYDTFRTRWRDLTMEDAFVTFALRADGSIQQFTMAPVSELSDFSFDYGDLLFRPVVDKQ